MTQQIELTVEQGNELRAICNAMHIEPHSEQPQPRPAEVSPDIAELETLGLIVWHDRQGWFMTRLGAMWMQQHR